MSSNNTVDQTKPPPQASNPSVSIHDSSGTTTIQPINPDKKESHLEKENDDTHMNSVIEDSPDTLAFDTQSCHSENINLLSQESTYSYISYDTNNDDERRSQSDGCVEDEMSCDDDNNKESNKARQHNRIIKKSKLRSSTIETLNFIKEQLSNYKPGDELDDEDMITIIEQMSAAASKRFHQISLMKDINEYKNFDDKTTTNTASNDIEYSTAYSNDDDIEQYQHLRRITSDKHHQLVNNFIDYEFFNSVISEIKDNNINNSRNLKCNTDKKTAVDTETSSTTLSTRLDSKAINTLRLRLGIVDMKKRQRSKRYPQENSIGDTDISMASSDYLFNDDVLYSIIDNNETKNKRLTRGMVRDDIKKRKGQKETKSMESLLSALTDLENSEGGWDWEEVQEKKVEVSTLENSRLSKAKKITKKKEKDSSSSITNEAGHDGKVTVKRKYTKRKRPLIALMPSRKKVKQKPCKVIISLNGERFLNDDVTKLKNNIETQTIEESQMNKEQIAQTIPSQSKTLSNSHKSGNEITQSQDSIVKRKSPENMILEHLKKASELPRPLYLLDWLRRYPGMDTNSQFTKYSRKEPRKKSVSFQNDKAALSEDIDHHLIYWENLKAEHLNLYNRISKEPKRKSKSNYVYGLWCSQLLNCLRGNGRLMARYEFFYSDIDRAWFNDDPFKHDLAKLGIPTNIKLTRTEWSLIRRKMKRRPRRFSKRFILSQMNDLELYRSTVRMIQKNYFPAAIRQNFNYEVLAPIKVGATVTAYHRKARLLHRGVILARDDPKCGYLVQFEKKELGCAACMDTEIASHGVPEIIWKGTSIASDGSDVSRSADLHQRYGSLTCGTSYGNINGNSIGTEHRNEASHFDVEKLINTVTERKTLVKLMEMIESSLAFKQLLLAAIQECHSTLENGMITSGKSSRDLLSTVEGAELREEYAWLYENMKLTDQAIESSLVHLQILYGDVYATAPKLIPQIKESKPNTTSKMLQEENSSPISSSLPDVYSSRMTAKWKNNLISLAAQEGERIMSEVTKTMSGVSPDSIKNATETIRAKYVDKRVSSAIAILLHVDAIFENKMLSSSSSRNDSDGKMTVPKKSSIMLPEVVVDESIRTATNAMNPIEIKGFIPSELMEPFIAREDAFRELGEAMSLLRAELNSISS